MPLLPRPRLPLKLAGPARVIDGDTIELAGRRIRLQGVAAREALVTHAKGKAWRCEGGGDDHYGRLLATCFVGGEDIDRWLVGAGWALSFVRYSHAYDDDEKAARDARRGLWSGAFVAPWEWRDRNCKTTILGAVAVPIDAQRKLCGSPDVPPRPGCEIKANMKPSRSAACIFHLPGSRGYGRVRMDRAERRWFCSVEEARTAGCREALMRR